MTTCSVDFETRSTLDLRKTGVYPYAEHPDTDVWCMAYAFDDGPVELWVPGDEVPWDLEAHLMVGGVMRAWNAQFERVVWRDLMVPRYGFPEVPDEKWYCTQAEAIAMAFPRSLGWAADVLNVPEKKDDDGRSLMLQMAKPRRIEDDGTVVWWDDDDRIARLSEYCLQDVVVERAIATRIRRLGPSERNVYLVDQRINDRGVRLDMDLVGAAQRVVDRWTDEANDRLSELTDGVVTKVTQVTRLHGWVNDQGVETDNLQKHTLRDLLDGDLPEAVREALELRRDIGKTSAAKLASMVNCECSDGYARGLLQYHGASTGRWSGQLIQPQNFPRGEVKDVERFIDPILRGEPVDHEKPVVVVSSLLRAMFTASPGHRLMAGDFSQIEARVLGWLADEPYGAHEYEKMGALIFGCDPQELIDKHAAGEYDERRQVGKNTILGCGYQMGAVRYKEQAWEQTGLDLSDAVCEKAVDTYRSTKPGIPRFWRAAEMAAMAAVQEPGTVHYVGTSAVRYVVRGQFLWCILPSGRPLAYALPRITVSQTKWGPRSKLTYMGINTYTRRWERLGTYGGHLTENIVQAVARDLMAGAMVKLEDAGYRPILTVHDEVVCDTPDTFGSMEEFVRIMTEVPDWAEGCPVKADCWEGERYRK